MEVGEKGEVQENVRISSFEKFDSKLEEIGRGEEKKNVATYSDKNISKHASLSKGKRLKCLKQQQHYSYQQQKILEIIY